jgi:hypothetical protein
MQIYNEKVQAIGSKELRNALTKLGECGFLDFELNEKVLLSKKCNIDAAISILLEQ